jgi:hypothetical protein
MGTRLTSLLLVQMVGERRHDQEGSGEGNGAGNQQHLPPPPPLPPSIAQTMATQNEVLRQLLQNQQMYQSQGERQHQQHQTASYQDFLSTQPPLFTPTNDPLDADTWIRVMEPKFALLELSCSETNKAQFAVQ